MSFLHPWLLGLGTAAVGLPVLIHWLTRPRPVRFPISTLRFIEEAIRQRRAVHRLRDLIILGLRTAAVLLIVWAFARPLIGQRPLASAGEGGEACRVIVVDVSQSMAASVRGIEAFERARPAAARYLSYAPGLRANVILAGARPRAVFENPSSNLGALREALAAAGPRPEKLDVSAALAMAAEMLAKAPGGAEEGSGSFSGTGSENAAQKTNLPRFTGRREVVIVSDFQQSNWKDVDFGVLPEKTLIQLESVASAETPGNLAVLHVGSQGHAEQGGPIDLEAEVGNYSSTPRKVQVEFSLAGAVYRSDERVCPANGKVTLSTNAVLRAGGWQGGEARLLGVDDALKADDARPFVLNVRPGVVYLLVTREPAGELASSSYYVERALAPGGKGVRFTLPTRPEGSFAQNEPDPFSGRGTEKVLRVRPGQLDQETLAPADLVVLDHPGKLSAEAIGMLASLIARGKAVFYVAAEPVDASNLKLLVEAAGPALKMPVEFVPAGGAARRDLRLERVRSELPPFSVFGDRVSAAVSPLRFAGGLGSRRLEGGLPEDVAAVYSDQTAALVVTNCGSGSLAVLNADLPASNLPGSPVFVPLVGELAGRLLGEREAADAVFCGEAVVIDLPAEAGPAAGLNVNAPAEEKGSGSFRRDNPEGAAHKMNLTPFPGGLVDEAGGTVWRLALAGGPGVYRVQRGDATCFALATAIAPQESDLRTLDPARLAGRGSGERQVHYRMQGDEEEGRDNLWVWLAVGCVGCMLAEIVALKVMKS
jgi:hypothetical protein